MKKLFLSAIGFALICRLNAHAQSLPDTTHKKPDFSLYTPVEQPPASTGYDSKELHIDEIDLVGSYYLQNGNHSPITGGIGTEHVTDIATGLDLKLAWQNEKKNTLSFGFGFDHHTSASAAYVNVSGASKTGGSRIYPSFDFTTENLKKGTSFGFGAYYSGEYNYKSLGADLHFSVKTHDRNGEFSAKFQTYLDQVSLIYPSEFVPQSTTSGTGTVITTASGQVLGEGEYSRPKIPTSPRNTYAASFGYSQIVNSRLQVEFLTDLVAQNGYLGLPFHRVYFNTGRDTIEKLPSNRYKLPIGFRANYFVGDNIIIRTYYRYYVDSWGIKSNTANLEIPVKISPFLSISPFYRYYDQSAAKYFAPYETHSPSDQYYTSNYAYSKFRSDFFGVGFRIAPPGGVFGYKHFHDLEIRYGHYTQSTDLVSDVISFNIGFK